MHVPKAFLILNDGYQESAKLRKELKDLCKEKLAVFSVPHDFEVRTEFPKTLYNKVDFKRLEKEEIEKREKEDKEKK